MTSGGELLKFVDKKKVKIFKLPVQSKNPLLIFINSILNNEPIRVFNNGKMRRDFTYIDDIVEGIFRCCLKFLRKLGT